MLFPETEVHLNVNEGVSDVFLDNTVYLWSVGIHTEDAAVLSTFKSPNLSWVSPDLTWKRKT